MQHTAPPWHHQLRMESATNDAIHIIAPHQSSTNGDPIIEIIASIDIPPGHMDNPAHEIANAKHIVRAVNAHDALLDVAKRMIRCDAGDGARYPLTADDIQAARSVLAKAEGAPK